MIKAEPVQFVLDERALHELLASPTGPVAKELARLGARIEGEAKQLLSGDLVNVDTGRLRSSTTWKLFRRGNNIGVAVGSGVWYARPVHDGGTFQIPSHTRRNPVRRRAGRGKKRKPSGGTHTVRAHSRTVTGRPYLRIAASRVLGRNV